MFRLNSKYFTMVLILLVAAPSAFAFELGGHDRDGAVVGLTMGHGWNSVQMTDGEGLSLDTGDVSTFTGGFKVGWARSDNIVGFIGISGWKRSFYQNLAPASVTNLNFMAEVYYYPTGQGLWAKGGIGTGSIDFYVNTADVANRVFFKEGGFTYTLGAGYEFRVSNEFAFGLAYDYTMIDLGDFGVITSASADNHVLAMTFHWYQD